ncbi:hypothetical protein FGO68_gene12943 [Halteria grandinella]|uniref:Uncharacterized protein n=1 Tax=Halteria grandinella TaxID=5974 RepID=A0A8J8TA72_HALGN|nr:hypothetical protein FGO68_gene12943 [Halteria grandinella]
MSSRESLLFLPFALNKGCFQTSSLPIQHPFKYSHLHSIQDIRYLGRALSQGCSVGQGACCSNFTPIVAFRPFRNG